MGVAETDDDFGGDIERQQYQQQKTYSIYLGVK
jgi:hypothetical protein